MCFPRQVGQSTYRCRRCALFVLFCKRRYSQTNDYAQLPFVSDLAGVHRAVDISSEDPDLALFLDATAPLLDGGFVGPSKWHASAEVAEETRALQVYVSQLASHDILHDEPVYAMAALGLNASGPFRLGAGIADLIYFLSPHNAIFSLQQLSARFPGVAC